MLPTPTHADLFGVPLEELMGYDGEKGGVPRVVKDCIQYLRETGKNSLSDAATICLCSCAAYQVSRTKVSSEDRQALRC